MAAVKSKNTSPEMTVRRYLHRAGFRFRLHSALPGRPDIVLRKFNAVIWVHGCFWHGHDCRFFRYPKTRADFWQNKIAENRNRDLRATSELRKLGWRQLVVWECSLKRRQSEKTLQRIEAWLHSAGKFKELSGQ